MIDKERRMMARGRKLVNESDMESDEDERYEFDEQDEEDEVSESEKDESASESEKSLSDLERDVGDESSVSEDEGGFTDVERDERDESSVSEEENDGSLTEPEVSENEENDHPLSVSEDEFTGDEDGEAELTVNPDNIRVDENELSVSEDEDELREYKLDLKGLKDLKDVELSVSEDEDELRENKLDLKDLKDLKDESELSVSEDEDESGETAKNENKLSANDQNENKPRANTQNNEPSANDQNENGLSDNEMANSDPWNDQMANSDPSYHFDLTRSRYDYPHDSDNYEVAEQNGGYERTMEYEKRFQAANNNPLVPLGYTYGDFDREEDFVDRANEERLNPTEDPDPQMLDMMFEDPYYNNPHITQTEWEKLKEVGLGLEASVESPEERDVKGRIGEFYDYHSEEFKRHTPEREFNELIRNESFSFGEVPPLPKEVMGIDEISKGDPLTDVPIAQPKRGRGRPRKIKDPNAPKEEK